MNASRLVHPMMTTVYLCVCVCVCVCVSVCVFVCVCVDEDCPFQDQTEILKSQCRGSLVL